MNWWQTSIRHHSATNLYSWRIEWDAVCGMLFFYRIKKCVCASQCIFSSSSTSYRHRLCSPIGISIHPNGFHLERSLTQTMCFGSNGNKTMYYWFTIPIARQVLIKFKSIWLYLEDYCCNWCIDQIGNIEFAEQSEIAWIRCPCVHQMKASVRETTQNSEWFILNF